MAPQTLPGEGESLKYSDGCMIFKRDAIGRGTKSPSFLLLK